MFIYWGGYLLLMKPGLQIPTKIENIVASTKLSDSLDLNLISEKLPEADYNRRRFPGVVIRMENPKLAALLFNSGKVVLTGAKSQEVLSTGLKNLVEKLKTVYTEIPENPECNVQNMVISADLGTHVNLNKIAMSLSLDKIEYEPEQFPGLVYRIDDPKTVVLLFGSGKLIITGGKSEECAQRAVEIIYTNLEKLNLI